MRIPIRRVTVIVLLVAVIYLILPLTFGLIAQHYSNDFLTQENQTVGNVLGLRFQLKRYELGWFHSRAILVISQATSATEFTPIERIPLTIKQGPIVFENQAIRFGIVAIESDNLSLPTVPNYHVLFESIFGLSGVTAHLSLIPNSGSDMPSSLKVDDLQLIAHSNLDADHFRFHLKGNGIHFTLPDQSITFATNSLATALDAQYLGGHHWDMRLSFALAKDKLMLTSANTTVPDVYRANLLAAANLHIDTAKVAQLLTDVVVINTDNQNNQPVPESAWLDLGQQALTQLIASDTTFNFQNFSFTAPAGQVLLNYSASFPSLPAVHDYYDVMTRGITNLMLSVPDWSYINNPSGNAYTLTGLRLGVSNNTIFSRELKFKVGAFDVKSTQQLKSAPLFYISNLLYQDHGFGDPQTLSQQMQWQSDQLCFSQTCFQHLNGSLNLLNMNFTAFRSVSEATAALAGLDPADSGPTLSDNFDKLQKAYIGLVTPRTTASLAQSMQTPEGDASLKADFSWPNLMVIPSTTLRIPTFLESTHYQIIATIPANYVDAILTAAKIDAEQAAMKQVKGVQPPTWSEQAAAIIEFAIQQKYLKLDGKVYQLNLTGKAATHGQ